MDADINDEHGSDSGSEHGTLGDGSHFDGTHGQSGNGETDTMVVFADGTHAHVVSHADGSLNENVTGPHGEQEAAENNQSGGQGEIQFADGSMEHGVNVNEQGDNQNGQHGS